MSELLLVVALILQIQNNQPIGSATGFFYSDQNKTVYFVTNKHVVSDEVKKIKPEKLRIRLHSSLKNIAENVDYDIPLYDKGKPKWHLHKGYGTKGIDIAVIEVDQSIIQKGFVFRALNASNFFPKDFLIAPGEDVVVLGFPRGFSDTENNLPILRNAMIATAFDINFQGKPLFLIDANLHPGMSGSPVMTKPKNTWPDKAGNTNMLTGTPTYFLGIFSANLSLQIPKKGEESLGLGYVWYGYLIEEIIQIFARKKLSNNLWLKKG